METVQSFILSFESENLLNFLIVDDFRWDQEIGNGVNE